MQLLKFSRAMALACSLVSPSASCCALLRHDPPIAKPKWTSSTMRLVLTTMFFVCDDLPRRQLQGCDRVVLGHSLGQYCSKRHFYSSFAPQDALRQRAVIAAAVLASQVTESEASTQATVAGYDFQYENSVITLPPAQLMIDLNQVLWFMLITFLCFLFFIRVILPKFFVSEDEFHEVTEVTLADAEVPSNDMVNPEAERLREHLIRRNEEAMYLRAEGIRHERLANNYEDQLEDPELQVSSFELESVSWKGVCRHRLLHHRLLRDCQKSCAWAPDRYHLNRSCDHIQGHSTLRRPNP